MARRYVNPARRDGSAWDALAEAGRDQQLQDVLALAQRDPELAAALRRELMGGRIRARAGALPAGLGAADAAEPLGAALDQFAWAANWGAFMTAISDREDRTGARAAIGRVMESRPRDAFGERVPSEGGFLVPERLRQQVLAYMTTAVVRPRASVITMDSLRVPVPVLDNPSQASSAQALGGLTFSMVQEATSIPATAAGFGRIDLEARKAAAYLANVPNELVTDSPAFGDFLARIIGKGYGWFEDDLFIGTGTGVGEPQALVNAPGGLIVTRNTSSKVLDVDVVAMLKALHPASKTTAVWLIGEDAFDQLADLYLVVGTAPSGADVTPSPLLEFDLDHGCWRLVGLPAFVTDHQAAAGGTGDVMLADLSQYLIGDRQELVVEQSAKGAGFITDTSSFRVKARLDARFWPQSTITLANGKVTSPLVILQ
jgi:HK97 family phage major capsid protein